MPSKYAKVSEIAERFRVSSDAVYLWIRQGRIPSDCIVRIAGTVRVDEEQFELRLRAGALFQRTGRKTLSVSTPESAASAVADDSFTTTHSGPRTEHRWASDTGSVRAEHPYSPAMMAATERSKA